MADDSSIATERPSSPESQLKGFRRERRKSDVKNTPTTNVAEGDTNPGTKKGRCQDRHPRFSNFPEVWEEAISPSAGGNGADVETHQPRPGGRQESRPTLRQPRLPSHAVGANDSTATQDLRIKLHDISQSTWIEDPNNHSTEKVYLTIEEAPLAEMVTIAPSAICWM